MKRSMWGNLRMENERIKRLRRGLPPLDAPDVKVTLPPPRAPATVPAEMVPTSTPGRRICIECAHYARRDCTNPQARHPVTGTHMEATSARKDRYSCGPQGDFWQARKAVPRKRLVDDGSEPEQYIPPVPFRVVEWKPYCDDVVAVLWERPAPAVEREPMFGRKYRGPAPGPTAMQCALAAYSPPERGVEK